MAASSRLKLTVDAVLKIRDLYAETVQRGSAIYVWHQRKYSHAQIAKIMDCSEGTVFRVVNRLGAYAFVGGDSMLEVKADPRADAAMAAASAASLAKLQEMLATPAEGALAEEAEGPAAALSPELQAKVDAINAKAKLGN